MGVVKSKRNESKIEFEMLFFELANDIDVMVEHFFFANAQVLADNRTFIAYRSAALERCVDDLLLHIKIANSIYPQCLAEWEERRIEIGKAIGTCYTILTHYQRVMLRLKVKDGKYATDVMTIQHMINSLKAWRKSDNKFKSNLK